VATSFVHDRLFQLQGPNVLLVEPDPIFEQAIALN